MSEEENLWIEVVRNKYLIKDEFMNRKTRNTDSWAWKKINNTRNLLQKGMRWKLGNGKKISFWTDLWCGDENLLKQQNKHASEVDLNLRVEHFITCDKSWNVEKLKEVVGRHQAGRISKLPIPYNDVKDEKC